MPYEEDYKMWLEKALIGMNPDWVCDEMSDNEFTHNWCCQYCGEDDAYITPKCLHMYYHHIERADHKTESSSEKPNNSIISKMEQVDELTGYNLSPVEDESQTADVCTWDGKVGEIEIHNILYEPTYNEDDGSM